ncbi:MAG: hydantoinase B/oxoprolinase family protein [Pirellulales bacterium]|nr:hydantoinase B/oxoprolinase family protein [Pirellulales bacterium]
MTIASDWEFWIDVGGTFTDCFGRAPDGCIHRCKVLSSGVTQGVVSRSSTLLKIIDPARASDRNSFWIGYQLRILDETGEKTDRGTVANFEPGAGRLILEAPLEIAPREGTVYELVSGEEAPILAIRRLLGLRLDEPIPDCSVRLGTTRGTNALLTRRGAETAFVTTRGFADVLRIGYQNRPQLFELAIHMPEPLFGWTLEVDERVTPSGEVLRKLDLGVIRADLQRLKQGGARSLAICLLNAYAFSAHEELVEQVAREVGFEEVSRSSVVAPLVKLVSRGDTTVVDAYLNPVLRQYVRKLERALPPNSLRMMTSAGGLVSADKFSGKDSILSGPAGGVVGFARVAEAAGFKKAIGFDMGGTSTDVARYDGEFEREYETEKAGVRIVAPMMAIETVAAGGGSVCSFDGIKLTVGPESAGADPGPACYGRGGPLAVTDVNYYLGRVPPHRFPFVLDLAAVERRIDELRATIETTTGCAYSRIEICEGFLRIANENMVQAIRAISIARGYDPREYVLVAFGGAAGQHACAIAEELSMSQVLVHEDAGILSAYGIGAADVVRTAAVGIYRPYEAATLQELECQFANLARPFQSELRDEGFAASQVTVRCSLDLRYQGLDACLSIPVPADSPGDFDFASAYAAAHEQLYGYRREGCALEVVAARVEVIGRSSHQQQRSVRLNAKVKPVSATFPAVFASEQRDTAIFSRDEITSGDRVSGPAIIQEQTSTTVVAPGWSADVLSGREVLLERHPKVGDEASVLATDAETSTTVDPVMLEVFNNQFAGIAEQMGITLRNTASSVNVKERLDFSCAVFTAEGDLVVNAPHIPVHLGAMSETVKRVLFDNPELTPGDVLVTNDPYRGGSHLPDVTVVTPVHDRESAELLFFTASRAHHAEIGGIAPGSMPPFSENLAEEGVLIQNFKLVNAGHHCEGELRELLTSGEHPTRAVEDNLADIAAQAAANYRGVQALLELCRRHSWPVVQAYMGHIQTAAETKARRALSKLADGRREFTDHMDDGTQITVGIEVQRDSATIDFTGTGPESSGNLNANPAIVTAAVLYVLRLLIDEPIPLNQGVLAPVEIVLPTCLLNPRSGQSAADSPAVAGGNVETSQRIVDVLLGALGLSAASAGTMNNTLFGDVTFGYYETICGGAGATSESNGANAVQTHMTNTRLTDAEIIEQRYPARVLEFAIRRGSGGQGRCAGGDGVIRRIEFLQDVDISLVTQRRGKFAPYGMQGGAAGKTGRNAIERANGMVEELPGVCQASAGPADVLIIETPGGGGWGKPNS